MFEQSIFWDNYQNAVSKFCFQQLVQVKQSLDVFDSRNGKVKQNESISSAIMGHDLEWCGSQSIILAICQFASSQTLIHQIKKKNDDFERLHFNEVKTVQLLRREINQTQQLSDENEWKLQEQILEINKLYEKEKDINAELRKHLSNYQNKIIEVDAYMGSEEGKLCVQFEEELAKCKLRVAELEGEKDELELLLNKRQ